VSSTLENRGAAGLPLLWRAGLRQLIRRPAQLLLAIAGVALGVAVVIAVDLASSSAERAFGLATEAVTGRATDQIVGGPNGLPDSLFARLVLATGVTAAPIVEDYVLLPAAAEDRPARATGRALSAAAATPAAGTRGKSSRVLHLLGIDPFSEGPLRPYLGAGPAPSGQGGGQGPWGAEAGAPWVGEAGGAGGGNLAALLLRSGTCLLAASTATELGLRPGDRFLVRAGGARRQLELVGVLRPATAAARQALADLLVMDIAAAQELLGRVGRLDQIDLRLPAGDEPERPAGPLSARSPQIPQSPQSLPSPQSAASPRSPDPRSPARSAQNLAARIDALLPPGARRLPAAGRTAATFEMTRAFRVNLTALSLLALLCGAFLIFNTMTFSVVQRRPLLGTLRTLGVTRAQILALVLGEAGVVALLGTAGGCVGGVLLGRGLLRLVTQTINDLYFVLSVRDLALSPASFVKGAAIGIGATLAAALAPALEAAFTPPRGVLDRSRLEARLRRALPRSILLGAGLLSLGGVLLAAPVGDALALGFLGMGAVVVGFAMLAPAATVGLMRLLRPGLGRLLGVRGRMAAGGVVASLSRTAVAIAALMVAVSVAVGIGVMIDSFRQTVVRWLDDELQADIYVTGAGGGGSLRGSANPAELAARAAALPGVAAVHRVRRVELATANGPVRLIAVDNSRRAWDNLELLEGDHPAIWQRVAHGDEALVSESFARRHHLRSGDAVTLPTAAGEHPFTIAGVYADFASDLGLVMIGRPTYLRYWHDSRLSGFSLDLSTGRGAPPIAGRIPGSSTPPNLPSQPRLLKPAGTPGATATMARAANDANPPAANREGANPQDANPNAADAHSANAQAVSPQASAPSNGKDANDANDAHDGNEGNEGNGGNGAADRTDATDPNDADIARTIRLLRQAFGPDLQLAIQSNRALKRLSLEIFDRTFLITNVLRLLAGLVAAIGVLSALTALQLERGREIGVLRATGMTPGEVWQLVTTQTGLIGLAAGLMALPVGLALSAIMVYIINRRSFGWTIHLEISLAVLAEALLLALAAALGAGLYPAYRMARTSPALALREE
jgi:putative ABC transport system permease protein